MLSLAVASQGEFVFELLLTCGALRLFERVLRNWVTLLHMSVEIAAIHFLPTRGTESFSFGFLGLLAPVFVCHASLHVLLYLSTKHLLLA